jgi:hypothetical protein
LRRGTDRWGPAIKLPLPPAAWWPRPLFKPPAVTGRVRRSPPSNRPNQVQWRPSVTPENSITIKYC